MDGYTFIATPVEAIAWPSMLLVWTLIFRDPLGRLITSLTALRYKSLEVTFGQTLDDVRRDLNQVYAGRESLPDHRSELAGRPPIDAMEDYFEAIAEVSPRAAILEAWIGFETTSRSSAQVLDLLADARTAPLQRIIDLLHRKGLFTESEVEALTRLRGLRNEVVHGPEVHLPVKQAAEYAALLREIGEEVGRRTYDLLPKNC